MTTGTQSPADPSLSAADRAAAAAVPQLIVSAWKNQDAAAFAAVFTDDGSMILPGVYLKGRNQIQTFMTSAFAGPYKGTQVTGQPLDVRFFSDDAGIIITGGGVLTAGETEVAAERAIRASWVIVKQEKAWQLAAYHNCPSE